MSIGAFAWSLKKYFNLLDVLLQPSAGKLSMNQWAIPQAQVVNRLY